MEGSSFCFVSLLDSPSSPSQGTCSLLFLRGKISLIYPNGLLMGLVSQGCPSHQQDVGSAGSSLRR